MSDISNEKIVYYDNRAVTISSNDVFASSVVTMVNPKSSYTVTSLHEYIFLIISLYVLYRFFYVTVIPRYRVISQKMRYKCAS